MKDAKSLGHFISERRKIMRLTQEELAKMIGVSKSAVAKWEADGGLPDRDNLKKLSDVMYVSVDELHRVIERTGAIDMDLEMEIAAEVIATIELCGHKIIIRDYQD